MAIRSLTMMTALLALVVAAGCDDCGDASYPHCPGPPGGATCVDGKWSCNPPDDMCFYGEVSGVCMQPDAVVEGNCFESPRCRCVFPEAIWVCCYAGYGGHDAPGLRIGDPCCGENVVVGQPGYPCYCDGTHHWTCPFDLGTTD